MTGMRRFGALEAAAGYADQSYLDREFREFAGITPSEFVTRLIPGGGIVGSRSSNTARPGAVTVGA